MRIAVRCGGNEIVLGVPIPATDGFRLDTRLPVKRFTQGTPEFYIIGESHRHKTNFVPIRPEEPFSYIEKLKDSFLIKKYGSLGINVPEGS